MYRAISGHDRDRLGCDDVADEIEESPWDGVMADNDIFDDYYGLKPPIEGGRTLGEIRNAIDRLIDGAGSRLNKMGRILVPNIAESRRDPGRWARHSAYGGGFEEVWMAYGPDEYLDPDASLARAGALVGPDLRIVRTASDGLNEHRNFLYGLAALWIFGGGECSAFTATAHDSYSGTLTSPSSTSICGGEPQQQPAAARLLHTTRRITVTGGSGGGGRLDLPPHHGVLLHRES